MGFLPLVPLAVVVIALAAPVAGSHLSAMSFTVDSVAVRNFPRRTQYIPLSEIDRFDEAASDGAWAQVRRVRTYLLLNDGSRLVVRRCADSEAGSGVTAFNNRLDSMRRSI